MNSTQSVSTFAALDLGFPVSSSMKTPKQRVLDKYGVDQVEGVKKPKVKGIVAIAKRAFEALESLYHNHVPFYLRERVKWIKNLSNKVCRLCKHISKLVLPIIDAIRNTADSKSTESMVNKVEGR